jgi:hypothetical protein
MKSLLFSLVAMAMSTAMAQPYPHPGLGGEDRIVLRLGGEHFRGQGNVIKLKQRIKAENPYMDLSRARLDSVVVVGKSKHGRGTVALRAGGQLGYPETLNGSPYDFHDPARYTFDRVRLDSPGFGAGQRGPWQLVLNGNIKIKRIVVKLKRRQRIARCQSDLVTRRGRVIDTFTGVAQTRQLACLQARKQCARELRLRQLDGRNPYARCEVNGLL